MFFQFYKAVSPIDFYKSAYLESIGIAKKNFSSNTGYTFHEKKNGLNLSLSKKLSLMFGNVFLCGGIRNVSGNFKIRGGYIFQNPFINYLRALSIFEYVEYDHKKISESFSIMGINALYPEYFHFMINFYKRIEKISPVECRFLGVGKYKNFLLGFKGISNFEFVPPEYIKRNFFLGEIALLGAYNEENYKLFTEINFHPKKKVTSLEIGLGGKVDEKTDVCLDYIHNFNTNEDKLTFGSKFKLQDNTKLKIKVDSKFVVGSYVSFLINEKLKCKVSFESLVFNVKEHSKLNINFVYE